MFLVQEPEEEVVSEEVVRSEVVIEDIESEEGDAEAEPRSDWVDLRDRLAVRNKLEELETYLRAALDTSNALCRKLQQKQQQLLILCAELHETEARIARSQRALDALRDEKRRQQQEHRQLKNQEIAEKEKSLEKHSHALFEKYKSVTSVENAELHLRTIARQKQMLDDMELLTLHRLQTLKKDDQKHLKRKKTMKFFCKRPRSNPRHAASSGGGSGSAAGGATGGASGGVPAREESVDARLDRIRHRMRLVLDQHDDVEMELFPSVETDV